jgi:hypothetical protein
MEPAFKEPHSLGWGSVTGARGQNRMRPVCLLARKRTNAMPDSDYLLDAAQERWLHILMTYQRFEAKKPVMLLDIQEQQIYAYPYADFSNDLSEKSQRSLNNMRRRCGKTRSSSSCGTTCRDDWYPSRWMWSRKDGPQKNLL